MVKIYNAVTWSAKSGVLHVFVIVALVLIASWMQGCSAGRGPGGEVILGIDVASLPETTSQVARLALGTIGGPWGDLAFAAVSALGIFGTAAAVGSRARRRGERDGWDEAHRETSGVVLDRERAPAARPKPTPKANRKKP